MLGTVYCNNYPYECTEQLYPNSTVSIYGNYSNTDKFLYNQLTNSNASITIYTKIYAKISLTDTRVASLYYPSVKTVIFIYFFSIFKNLIFKHIT